MDSDEYNEQEEREEQSDAAMGSDDEEEEQQPETSASAASKREREGKGKRDADDPERRQQKSGVIYIQTVPPFYTVSRMREVLSKYGEVGRIFLHAEKTRAADGGKKRKRYTEGWVEFKDKRVAKRVAQVLNGSMVGGKKRSPAYDSLWAMKYLSGFKWMHLIEQLVYERRVEEQRMRVEISQAKRQAEHFADQVEKGAKIKRLEEKMLKKGGLWKRYQRQVQQRQLVQETKKKQSRELNESDNFLQMIFDKE